MRSEIIFSDVMRVEPIIHSDERGSFSEDYNFKEFSKIGIEDKFLQDNISLSLKRNTIRGMHFQKKPFSQSKLVKVLSGSIFDVFIDLRKQSSTCQKYGSVTLGNGEGWLYIPEGFAHGFCTLEDDTKVLYKVNKAYNSDSDSGIIYNDPFFSINWPLSTNSTILSKKDKNLSSWEDIKDKVDL